MSDGDGAGCNCGCCGCFVFVLAVVGALYLLGVLSGTPHIIWSGGG